ncbi:MAG: hypothetical protein JNN11_03475 [Candidatus Doudnabacteria bacterium]|nr:hypothetical protein [Candidatus Doudnabacteria bacterium]
MSSLKKGEVTTESYQIESEKLGRLGAAQVENEIDLLDKSVSTLGKQIITLGIGLMRDWGFVKKANQLGMSILALDVSDYACEMADRFFASQVLPPGVENRVMQMDVNQRLGSHCGIEFLEPKKTFIIYAAQFLQVLQGKHRGEDRAKRLLFGLSKFLEFEHRRVVMVHLLPEDNSHRKASRLGESIMYPLEYILPPLSGSLQTRRIEALRMQKGMFYDDTYSAFTIVKR